MPIDIVTALVADLRFDPHNPRLPEDVERDQPEMFSFIVREIGVDDLLDSFGASGIIEADPIIVRSAEPHEEAGRFYVVEGNRRLAALKLLNGDRLGDGEAEKSLPFLAADVAESIKTVHAQTGWDEDKLEAYLGYKHVTSTREWAPEAKARFVIERCKGDFSPGRLEKFARRLGTRVPTLKRWLVAHLVLSQAEAEGFFKPEEAFAKRYFGSFYTLLGSQEVQSFLGLGTELSTSPIPAIHISNLKDFVDWTIGTKKSRPFVNSRSQKQLNAVLASPSAIKHLRVRRNLESALMYTEFNSQEIAAKLETAAYSIEECLTKLFDVKDDKRVQAAIGLIDSAYQKLKVNSRQDVGE